eukprot:6174167-Pleurochrysis_carterae.AAC.2
MKQATKYQLRPAYLFQRCGVRSVERCIANWLDRPGEVNRLHGLSHARPEFLAHRANLRGVAAKYDVRSVCTSPVWDIRWLRLAHILPIDKDACRVCTRSAG